MPEFLGESAWEAHSSVQKRYKRQPTPCHKGVYFRQRNQKFVARLCLPGGKSRKLDLGEYNTHDAAARAYRVGAFYYDKSLDSTCEEDQSFIAALPCVPDNLSDAEKLLWVRRSARQSAASIDTSERSASKSVLVGRGCSSLEAHPSTRASYGIQASCGNYYSPTPDSTASGSAVPGSSLTSFDAEKLVDIAMNDVTAIYNSSLEACPGTPASYGTQASCGNFNSLTATPTSSRSAAPENSSFNFDTKESDNEEVSPSLNPPLNGDLDGSFSDWWDFDDILDDTFVDRHKRKSAAPHMQMEIIGFKRRKSDQTRFKPNMELQKERSTNSLNNQASVADHQAVSQFKMTDSILIASCELRKQGWEWTLKLRSASSADAGVLYSVPQGQHAAPALPMTDIIIESFYELREQGWEVHLEPRKCDKIE